MSAQADSQPQRILLIKPSSLGDVVHALPVLAALRENQPRAYIAWLVATPFVSLLEGHPLLDEVIPFDRQRYGRMLINPAAGADFWRFVWGLRRRRFDLVIDLQGLFRSGFFAFATGARRRVGFTAAREFGWLFYNERYRGAPDEAHAVDKNVALIRAAAQRLETPRFPLALTDVERRRARELVAQAAGQKLASFVAVVPGARWETKLWRPDRLATLIDRLRADGAPPCVLLGAPSDRAFAARIQSAVAAPVVDLVGRTTLRELAALLDQAELVVCHDSGPMHVAAAVGTPLVALFGPTNPSRTGPYSDRARVVSLGLDCAPCYRRQCPLGHQNCLGNLPVELVLDNVRELRRWNAADGPPARSAVPASPSQRGT